jgi:hypothetical protein
MPLKRSSGSAPVPHRLSVDDIHSILGDIEDAKAAAILATGASRAELEEAYLYAQGEGDKVDRAGHPLTGVVADLYEILTADEDEPAR